MDWIKRNLVFVVGGVITLVLMGLAGWYCYSGWSNNAQQKELITVAYEELKTLYANKPAPGDGKKVNNIALAKEQQQEAREFLQKLAVFLQPIPALPPGENVTGRDYSAALQETITLLQREATNSSVILPSRYRFSFEKQAGLVTFAPGTLAPLATQLGEVKVISDVLNTAKINSLDAIRRERIPGSPDDLSGPVSDYIDFQSTTNELAIISPYEITFRCFTPELAAVLAGFAQSPYGLIVRAINVEPALDSLMPQGNPYAAPVYYQQPVVQQPQRYMEEGGTPGGFRSPFANRYGQPAPVQPVYAQPTYAQASRSGLQPFLNEKQLKVTLLLHVVKLLPPQS